MSKTKYFQNCLGVFQGGGCKGSAYVGAYKECIKRGVSFSEVVGTSAGSIIAVLIGAGANPSELEEIISEINFEKFLSPPLKLEYYSAPKIPFYVKFTRIGKYSKIVSHLGLHNSNYIKEWLDEKLKKLLPAINGPIKFKHLIIPTSVVVTDIRTKRVEVFSNSASANNDVSEAVQSSCNIPFYFQPIDMRYLDGGMLSNLPAFIFKNNESKIYNKILAFSLISDNKANPIQSFEDYIKAILDTALEGATDIQISLQEDLHIINIKTGTIGATDFEKITPQIISYLINQGEEAVKDFFNNEIANIKSTQYKHDVGIDSFNTNNFLTKTSEYNYKEILICESSTEWVYEIFPTLLKWVDNGSKISLLLNEKTDDKNHTAYRQRLLTALGVNIFLVDELPFRGYIFDGEIKEKCKAIILNTTNNKGTFHSKLYGGDEDFDVIKMVRKEIIELIKIDPVANATPLKIERVDNNELINKLKVVNQYSTANIQISIQEINIEEVIYLTKYVRGYKYRQIENLFTLYDKYGISYFEPVKLLMKNGKYTLITPPVIEKIGEKMYVIEGNTRLTYAYKNGLKKIHSIVITGVKEPLPSKGRFMSKEILLTDKELIGEDRYDAFDYVNFRSIEKAVRDPKTCLIN